MKGGKVKANSRPVILLGIVLGLLASELWSQPLFPQAGVEYYFGANKFRSLKPWAGARVSLSGWSSVLAKFTFHDLEFEYINETETRIKRQANLGQFIVAFYYAREKIESYAAASYFRGTDGYTAYSLDAGSGYKLSSLFEVEAGFYLLDEASVLWYPDEPMRRIKLGAIRAGLNLNLAKGLRVNPQLYLYRNSEDVSASTLAVSLIFIPREPFTFVFTFWNYRESAQYRFSGQYFSVGLHLYY